VALGLRLAPDRDDLVVIALPAPSTPPKPSPSPPVGNPPGQPVLPIATALRAADAHVRIEGQVTVPASLLDGTGRRIIVQDRTAAVEVLLPSGTVAPRPGIRLRIDGEMGTAYGARGSAESIIVLGTAPSRRGPRRSPGPPTSASWSA
jgi:hypothetical protein